MDYYKIQKLEIRNEILKFKLETGNLKFENYEILRKFCPSPIQILIDEYNIPKVSLNKIHVKTASFV